MSRIKYGPGRPGWRTKVEARQSIDIRQLAREGGLVPGMGGNVLCALASRVSFYVESDSSLKLSYGYRDQSGFWQSLDSNIEIAYTQPHFGGDRAWFLCPECRRRVALIYLEGVRIACRICLDLIYGSQAEQPWDRARRMADRLLRKLVVGDDGLIYKPKRMKWATFERLYAEYLDLEDAADEGLMRVIARLMRKAA